MIESAPTIEDPKAYNFTPVEIDTEGTTASFSLDKPRFSELTEEETQMMNTLVEKIGNEPGLGEYLNVELDPMGGKIVRISGKNSSKIGNGMLNLINEVVQKSISEIQ